jgi:hypothetical protein
MGPVTLSVLLSIKWAITWLMRRQARLRIDINVTQSYSPEYALPYVGSARVGLTCRVGFDVQGQF